ncbi:MAG: cation-transporting P-type ATPase [Candidatus Bipolaricaulota bacterium]|nr:cation-transporting P-type ATPase [Candidatus Bipolaricaulota bacterium]
MPEDQGLRSYTLNISDVYAAAGSSADGLTTAEAQARLAKVGPNAIQTIKGKPLWRKFAANFTHLMALLLWAGGAMAFVGKMPQLGWAIWAVIVINAIFSFWQEFRAEKAADALKKLLPQFARVLRDGHEAKIPAEELVPGDVIILSEGDHISADARLVEENEMRVDLSTLNGESAPARRTAEASLREGLTTMERPNLVFAGTTVSAGTGKAVVFATGMITEFGKIARLTQTVGEDLSPLQKEVNRVTKIVTAMAMGIGLLLFFLSVFVIGRPLSEGFIFSVGMVVAFVPEGLLPTVTLSLAMGVQRMAKRNALIKKLSSVETLGSCTVICTDKTGTLTQNEMTVREAWIAGQHLTLSGVGYEPTGEFQPAPSDRAASATDLRELVLGAALCNNAKLVPPQGEKGWAILGDPTEAALLVAAAKGGLSHSDAVKECPRIRELPFDSARKRMSTIHPRESEEMAFVKGAPKEVLSLCTSILVNGEAVPMTDEWREQILSSNDAYARNALRVLAIARRTLPERPNGYTVQWVEQDLTFLGLLAMQDPPRPEVAAAVDKCRRAGIRIIMITGDYGLTAESIARRVGMVGEGARLVSGADLDAMSDDELATVLKGEVIFARAAPEHKLRVVTALKDLGEIVAVTGDGVNDAPALKKAHIGVAMGIAGTDVAKEAASMILLDDNFASIVNAIEEGRAVYSNIRKFTTYIFTSNTPEAWPFILQIVFNIPLALVVMQVLAVDLGTDLVPALALGTEKPEPGLMDRPPRGPKDRIVDRRLILRAFLWLGSLQTILCFAGFFFVWWTMGYRDLLHLPRADLLPYAQRILTHDGPGFIYVLATSMFHAGVITTQIGNAYACRTERTSVFKAGFFSNRFLLFGFAFELALIALMIYVQPLQTLFEEGPLPLRYWPVLFLYPPVMFFAEEGRKAIMRRHERRRAGGKARLEGSLV